MTDYVPVHERVIDRDEELTLFRNVLATATGPRVITVQDEPGMGKSWLLELFEETALETAIATVRAVLEDDPQLISLAEEIKTGLGSCGAPLPSYEKLTHARVTYDHTAFGLQSPPAIPDVRVDIRNINSHLHHTAVTGANMPALPMGWPDGHEHVAQQACLAALLDDLRDLSRKQPVVLLLDQYELATHAIRGWLATALLTRVLDSAELFGALVIVIASTKPEFPMLTGQLGPRSAEILLRILRLSKWSDEHIDLWLHRVGLSELPRMPSIIRGLLDGGFKLEGLPMIVDNLRPRRRG